MLDLEVQPERSLGNEQWEFLLGMPFYQAVYILQKYDTIIKGVQVWYSDERPLGADLVIDLTQDGIRLIFDSNTQQLKILEVYNLSKVKLKYCCSMFNSPSVPPTTQQIDQTFGATHPGVYHAESQLFVLNFRGLSFEFKLESKCEPRYTHGVGALQFRQGNSPLVSRMLIYTGNSLENTRPPPMPLNCFHGSCYLDAVDLIFDKDVCTALKFKLITEGNISTKLADSKKVTKQAVVRFGDTCQDVASTLGCPNKVYYKDDDKMRIHSSATHKAAQADRKSDYFFNYFTLGVDILFDSSTHRVIKFILHTNYPGHYDFNIFYRCKFNIPISPSLRADAKSIDEETPTDNIEVHYDSMWHSVQNQLIPQGKKPVVVNRTSTTNTSNPFGCTYCHAVSNIIFEVMQNDHISTVTIFRAS